VEAEDGSTWESHSGRGCEPCLKSGASEDKKKKQGGRGGDRRRNAANNDHSYNKTPLGTRQTWDHVKGISKLLPTAFSLG